jgi:rhamnose utilization protein RhaD (predicted bifunctional aldolase and dehydrogenase)
MPTQNPTTNLKHVTMHWNPADPVVPDSVEELIHRSNCLGTDQRITNTGGGNTSSKILEKDPLTGEMVEVMWVKGSGGDLRTSKKENFSSLYQSKLLDLQRVYASRADKGLKSPAEDEMVGMFSHCTFNMNPRPSSIDTPLHSFIPHAHVDHTHPNAAISVAACAKSIEVTKEIYGDEVVHIPWMRPASNSDSPCRKPARSIRRPKASSWASTASSTGEKQAASATNSLWN